jgi:transposase, IS5 family
VSGVPAPTAQVDGLVAASSRTHLTEYCYRTGAEGRISHLKRGYGLRRSRLKGYQGQRTWTGWAILAYDLDTLAIHTTT